MILTLYSFKGGVGRSMALANLAELYYQRGLRVLIIDFDLEAPGLERFFELNCLMTFYFIPNKYLKILAHRPGPQCCIYNRVITWILKESEAFTCKIHV